MSLSNDGGTLRHLGPPAAPIEEPKHTITIDYGYDVHSVELDKGTFDKIVAGEGVLFEGQGFLYEEEGWLVDRWHFNLKARDVRFWLSNGAELHARWVRLGDAGPVIDLLSKSADPEWRIVASRRNRGALDDWTEYLCIRVSRVPEEAWEMAVCGFPPNEDDQEVDSHSLQPIADNAVVDITDGGLEVIVARLEQLEWPESDLELVVQAIAAM